MTMKKVLIIIGKLYIGGAERVARDIGYFADRSKYDIHYLVFEDDIGAYEKELEDSGCVIHHLASPSDGYYKYYGSLKKLMEDERFDVVHSHTMFSSGWAMLAARKLGIPIRISHSHTIRGPEKRNVIKNLYENTMRRVIIKNSTELVACGNSAGRWLFGDDEYEKHGKLIYNGISLSSFYYDNEKRDSMRKELGIGDRFVIGHVGHLAPVKNQTLLLDIMPEVLKIRPESVLLLLGDGIDKEKLQQKIYELKLEKHVVMTGNVSNVGDYMSAMDVFCFPSLYEGMPLSLIEAQANGLPCLISDRIPGDAVLTDLVESLSIEDNENEWVNNIISAKRSDPESYGKKMHDMGFDTEVMLDRIYAMYDKEIK